MCFLRCLVVFIKIVFEFRCSSKRKKDDKKMNHCLFKHLYQVIGCIVISEKPEPANGQYGVVFVNPSGNYKTFVAGNLGLFYKNTLGLCKRPYQFVNIS